MLLCSIALVMPQASKEFAPKYATLLSAVQYAGLGLGAIAFGLLADLAGRQLAWQVSIFGVSIFTAVGAASPTWAALNAFVAIAAFFGGGNCEHLSLPPSIVPKLHTIDLKGSITFTTSTACYY